MEGRVSFPLFRYQLSWAEAMEGKEQKKFEFLLKIKACILCVRVRVCVVHGFVCVQVVIELVCSENARRE